MSDSASVDESARDPLALLHSLEAFSSHVETAGHTDALITSILEGLARFFGISHASLLLACDGGDRLDVLGSLGYETSGIGASVPIDQNVLRQTRRAAHLPGAFDDFLAATNLTPSPSRPDRHIARPSLIDAGSRLSLPLWDAEELLGALVLEDKTSKRFSTSHEAALNIVCRQVSLILPLMLARGPSFPAVRASFVPQLVSGRMSVVTHYAEDDSIVVAGDFVIKGMPGAILWRLLSGYVEANVSQSPANAVPELPPLPSNTEMLLVLLSRRLRDCLDFLRLKPIAAGSFLLEVDREITLLEIPK